MKKLLSFVLCTVLLLSCTFLNTGATVAKGGTITPYESEAPVTPPESDFTYTLMPLNNPTKVAITSYKGSETKIIIPNTINGLPVTNISANAFAGNSSISYVKLPAKLVAIAGNAFAACSALTEIDVDSSNENFVSTDGVLYKKNTDESSATFGEPETLSIFPTAKGGSFTVPYGVKAIGDYAFYKCFDLTSVDMYNTVTSIGSYAFSFCWDLESIRLSDNLTTLGTHALSHCEALRAIDLPSTLTSIGDDAVLGDIDSANNKVYFFTDGISCTEGTYAYDYLVAQALPASIIIVNKRSITDNDTGIRIVDAYDILPYGDNIDVVITPVEMKEVEDLLPITYIGEAFAFDISFTKNGEPYTPKGDLIIKFDSVCPDAIPSATKIYKQTDDSFVCVNGAVHTPFIGTQSAGGGRFVIIVNNKFLRKGDIDGDGIFSLYDVNLSLYAITNIMELSPEQMNAADADGDGNVTTEDSRKILRMAGGIE